MISCLGSRYQILSSGCFISNQDVFERFMVDSAHSSFFDADFCHNFSVFQYQFSDLRNYLFLIFY